jgi:hypothetical protein
MRRTGEIQCQHPVVTPHKERPSWVFIASLGFALLGLGTGIAATATSRPLAGDQLLFGAWIGVFVVMLLGAAAVLRGSARRSQVLGRSFLPLLVGSAGVGPGTVMLVNRFGSDSAQKTTAQRVTVVDHGTHTSKGQTTYSVSVAPFPPLDEPLELDVPASVYERCTRSPGRAGILQVGHGAVGMPFVVVRGFPAFDCNP